MVLLNPNKLLKTITFLNKCMMLDSRKYLPDNESNKKNIY